MNAARIVPLLVLLGCGDGSLTGALGASDRYHVQGLAASAEDLGKARKNLKESADYGRVSADLLEGAQLPYVDNLVNLVVAENLHGVALDEVMMARFGDPHGRVPVAT